MPPIFEDICELHTGRALNILTGEESDVHEAFRPKLVICENVVGLLKGNRGCEPQIHSVRVAFEEIGYLFAYTHLDARSFLLLQRRTRVWMWAIRSDVAAAPAAGEVPKIFLQLERPQSAPLVRFLRHVDSDKQARQTIN